MWRQCPSQGTEDFVAVAVFAGLFAEDFVAVPGKAAAFKRRTSCAVAQKKNVSGHD